MTVLVTGGSGFVGSRLLERLGPQGRSIDLRPDGRPETVVGDILEPAGLRAAMAGATAVVHLAAAIDVQESLRDPAKYELQNVEGTRRVLAEAARAGVDRIVFASSAAVYGTAPSPQRESSPLGPMSPYAASKVQAELACRDHQRGHGGHVAVLRFFNIYGPRQPVRAGYAAVIPAFARALRAGEPLRLHGGGGQTRDFVHIDDVVAAIQLALRAAQPWVLANVGSGTATSVRDLANTMIRVHGKGSTLVTPAQPGEVEHSCAAIDEARRSLGWTPRVGLETGLRTVLA